MRKSPLISVVLPVYNGEKYLKKSINSILKQSYRNFELIVVNDCSTDSTLEILKEFADRDNRIKIINNTVNLKLPRTLNVGFASATGDYYTWTSDDNMYKENAFEMMVNAMGEHPEVDLVYSDYTYIDSDDNITGIEICPEPENILCGNVCGACFMYTHQIAEKVGEYDAELFLAEDYDYWLRIFFLGKMFHLKNENLYLYRRHTESLTATKQNRIAEQTFKAYKKNFECMYSLAMKHDMEKEFLNKFREYGAGSYRKEANTIIMKKASGNYKSYYIKEKIQSYLLRVKMYSVSVFKLLKRPFEDIVDKKVNYIINGSANNYRFIHIIHNDKFCCPFVEFINEQFNEYEHMFIVMRVFSDLPFPKGNNVYEFYRLKNMDFSSNKIEKIILHSLFIGQLDYWVPNINILKEKVYWMIWGADLYEAPRTKIDDLVRKNFYGYISDTDGDCSVAKQKYQLGEEKVFIDAAYTFPITMGMIEKAKKKRKEHDYVRIQVNNSCDWSIIDMLKQLERFKQENIRIVCILSYGQGNSCKEEIIKTGNSIFGDKFDYLDKLCDPEDYACWLAENDIYILNQDRQQGLGNSFASLALGTKLYIKSTVTTYHHFNDKNIKVFDTLSINDISYNEFVKYDKNDRILNEQNVKFFFDNSYLKKCWEPVFYGSNKN